jgi:hypothetical protein
MMTLPTSAPAALHQTLGFLLAGRIHADDIPADQWATLSQIAVGQGLGPALFDYVRNHQDRVHLPRQEFIRLFTAYGQVRSFNRRVYDAVQEWAGCFAAHGITAIWLKGVALGATVYPDYALRPMVDADILAPMEQIPAALRLLEAETAVKPVMLGQTVAKNAMCRIGARRDVTLEVHWSLIDAPLSEMAPDSNWFLDQRTTVEYAGQPLHILRPEANVLYLSTHAIFQHGEASASLLRFYDIHQVITQASTFDWDLMVEKAAAFGWSYSVERALLLAQANFATPIPEGVVTRLQTQRAADVLDWAHPDQQRTKWDITQRRFSQMAWGDRVRLAFSLTFPPLAYMRYRYHLQNNWQALLHYPRRWWESANELRESAARKPGSQGG